MKNKKIKSGALIVIISLTIVIGYYIAKAATWGIVGFSWIGNNIQNGVEQGDPVIGMIMMKGSNYGVTLEGEGEQRNLVGSAWMGIGSQDDKFNDFSSQDDLPSLGWIHFNQIFDQGKLNVLISNNCYGAGDCHGVRWNKKPGSTNEYEGYLSGWARMEIGPEGDGTAYPEVWVHFKSPNDPNSYSCNENDKNYYVCVDPEGKMEGYAWSAGAESTSIENNPGLGWIKFSKQYVWMESGEAPTHTVYCANRLTGDQSDYQHCSSETDFNGEFQFEAYTGEFQSPMSFDWSCGSGGTLVSPTNTESTVICKYDSSGSHQPSLAINGQACQTLDSVSITSSKSCSIEGRKAETSNGSDYSFSKSLTISPSETVDIRIDKNCLDGSTVNWTGVVGMTKKYENNTTYNYNFSPTGSSGTSGKISASLIGKDGSTVDCGFVNIFIKDTEKVKWQ